MSTEREELAAIIKREYIRAVDRKRIGDVYTAPADAILAAGYRKPQPVTSAAGDIILETLDAAGTPKEFQFDALVAVQKLLEPRQVTTYEELDALPNESLVLASGRYLNGQGEFTDCWMRPIPDHVTGGTGARLWEVLIYLDGGVHNMTRNDCITLPVTVLYEGAA